MARGAHRSLPHIASFDWEERPHLNTHFGLPFPAHEVIHPPACRGLAKTTIDLSKEPPNVSRQMNSLCRRERRHMRPECVPGKKRARPIPDTATRRGSFAGPPSANRISFWNGNNRFSRHAHVTQSHPKTSSESPRKRIALHFSSHQV